MAKLLTQFEKWCPWCLLISSLYLLWISLSLTHNTKLTSLRNYLYGIRNKSHWEILEKCLARKTWQSYMYYGHTHIKTLKHNKDKADHATNNKCAGWGQDMQCLGFPQPLQVLSNRFLKLIIGGHKRSGHAPESTTKIIVWVGYLWDFVTGLTSNDSNVPLNIFVSITTKANTCFSVESRALGPVGVFSSWQDGGQHKRS